MTTTTCLPRPLLIAPSLLAADFSRLGEDLAGIAAAGADWAHLDVMDGHFVPNLTFGPAVVKALRRHSPIPFDCHLMVSQPDQWVPAFAEAGAQIITIHAEATAHLDRSLALIRDHGCQAGVALNPATSEHVLDYVLDRLDLVLVMSVNPGFGGQSFLPAVIDKIARIRAQLGARPVHVQVDGGITAATAPAVVAAGADVLVAGSAVFRGTGIDDWAANIAAIRAAALPTPLLEAAE